VLEEEVSQDGSRVVFKLFDSAEPLGAFLPVAGGWVVDFVLMRGSVEDGVFKLEVGTPCDSDDAVVGCHIGNGEEQDLEGLGLQLMDKALFASTSGTVVEDGEGIAKKLRSPVLGCQCGTGAAAGEVWVILVLLVLGLRRRSRG
jgi:MYXO-CTERM domain-containing protein